jgi:hypothetical protein
MSVISARISGVLRSSCILLGGEINHEEHEGHEEICRNENQATLRYISG